MVVHRTLAGSARTLRRFLILVLGGSVLLLGAAMIVLPGPALVVVPAGLMILGFEFAWARRWLRALRERLDGVRAAWVR
ncbi:MAG: PGPGW domain-containing protein [Deltaproteobacteria bacterium]|nr:MAG: PGPGW domain-containing protein [Deltaproteobacteria bacterium]